MDHNNSREAEVTLLYSISRMERFRLFTRSRDRSKSSKMLMIFSALELVWLFIGIRDATLILEVDLECQEELTEALN